MEIFNQDYGTVYDFLRSHGYDDQDDSPLTMLIGLYSKICIKTSIDSLKETHPRYLYEFLVIDYWVQEDMSLGLLIVNPIVSQKSHR